MAFPQGGACSFVGRPSVAPALRHRAKATPSQANGKPIEMSIEMHCSAEAAQKALKDLSE